jgi:hypothetical protein
MVKLKRGGGPNNFIEQFLFHALSLTQIILQIADKSFDWIPLCGV